MKQLVITMIAALVVLAACGDSLLSKMELTSSCKGGSAAYGTVRNGSDSTVSIAIHVDFLDGDGAVVADGIGAATGVRPGASAEWEASNIRGVDASGCRATISAVFPE